jgi:hypothetical protein
LLRVFDASNNRFISSHCFALFTQVIEKHAVLQECSWQHHSLLAIHLLQRHIGVPALGYIFAADKARLRQSNAHAACARPTNLGTAITSAHLLLMLFPHLRRLGSCNEFVHAKHAAKR